MVRILIDSDKLGAFCRKWKITEFSFFGSVLRDDFGPDSDVDLEEVWKTVTSDLPVLVRQLEPYLPPPEDQPPS